MLSSKSLRYVFAALAVGLVVWAAWTGWVAYQVSSDLTDSVDHANAVRDAAQNGNEETIDAELEALLASSSAAVERTSGLTWSALTVLPWIGDDAAGIKATSEVVNDLAADGIEPLVEVSDRVQDLLPREGSIDLTVVNELRAPISKAQGAFARADTRLQAQDDSGYIERFRTEFTGLRDQVHQASSAMNAARTAVAVLPSMLGSEEPRRYLMVFQNNAEIRATGGLPGAVTEVESDAGDLTIGRQTTGSSFGETTRPVLPLTAAERDLYGEQLGTYFLDANFTPDMPRAAKLMRARWSQAYPEDELDGVIMIDTVALSYILNAIGPVTVDGIVIDSSNAVDELLHGTYLRLPDPKDQDAFFAEVAAASFEKFTAGSPNPAELIRALSRSVDEGRTYIHSFEPIEQKRISGSAIAGSFVTNPDVDRPQVAVTLNDSTGAKMSYFLRQNVEVGSTFCSGGRQGFAAKAQLRSEAPSDAGFTLPSYITGGGQFGVPPGTQLVTVRVFGPVDGSIENIELNAEPAEADTIIQKGRPVAEIYVELAPGQVVDLTWTMRSGPNQLSEAAVSVTPSIESVLGKISVPTQCR